jgi:hypothetical protein
MKFCSNLEEANKVTTAQEGFLFEKDPETRLQSMQRESPGSRRPKEA